MSGDEILFEEVRYREPVRRVRPDRDRRWACQACQLPEPADLPIFIDHRAADAIERHALSDTSVELGGILLGKECLDEATGDPFVWITQALEARHYANTQASFTYTHDSWEEITRERDRLFPDLDIVGWYHTHPSFGIFLSHHDLFIHQHFFAQTLQVAYVVDPIQHTRGFFQWRDAGMAQVGGFFLTAERGDRVALARAVNELENLPNHEGSGGGILSPRLEAELIKMLTRPSSPYPASAVDRVQIAAIFGMLGTVLGVLGVAVVLWLYQLQGQIQEQNETLKALARSVEQAGEGQRLATDTLLEKVGGENPSLFVSRYERAAKARDEARQQLSVQQTINSTLGTRAKELETRVVELAADLETARKTLEKYDNDAKESARLRERLAELEQTTARQQQAIDEQAAIVESVEGKKAAENLRRLNYTRYAAYAGGSLSALLALAVVYLYYRPLDESAPDRAEPETHRIT